MATFLYDTDGRAVAFRRHDGDAFLFNLRGQWIGWFPWDDDEAVDTHGRYLATVVENRLLRLKGNVFRPHPGYPSHPGSATTPGSAPFAGFFGIRSRFEDVPAEVLK